MAKPKKKRSKKYDPAKSSRKFIEMKARKCALYRWGSSPIGSMLAQGPPSMTAQEIIGVMDWAKAQPFKWLVTVYACHLTEDGDYYEDSATFETPCVSIESDEAVVNLVDETTDMLKREGNFKHFLDTVATFRVLTDKASRESEDEAWLKKQAEYRAKVVIRELSK